MVNTVVFWKLESVVHCKLYSVQFRIVEVINILRYGVKVLPHLKYIISILALFIDIDFPIDDSFKYKNIEIVVIKVQLKWI